MTYKNTGKCTRVTAHATTLFFVALTISASNAQSINPTLDDVFQARFGPFFANFETAVDVQGSPFEQEQLGDNKTTAAAFGLWRITPKFHLRLGYSQLSAENTSTTDQPIGGIPGTAGTTLSQDYKTSSVPIALSYAFVKNIKTEFGISAGVNVTTVKNQISVSVPGEPTITPIDQDITEPLPTIGLFWNQALSPQWMLIAQAGYMGVEVGGLNGDFYSALLGVEWRPFANVGFGASYLYDSADGTITASGQTSTFDYQYNGPFAYLMIGGGVR